MGISTDAPVYMEMQGLEAGDAFDLQGHEHEIEFVA